MKSEWRRWIPVLGVKDAEASVAFYCEQLGFDKEWVHRFDPSFPVYASVSRGGLTLHLSEHGDREAPTTLVVSVEDVDAAYTELRGRGALPEAPPTDRSYGVREFALTDPDGHRLVFAMSLPGFETAPGRT